jgi:hypothetical protein
MNKKDFSIDGNYFIFPYFCSKILNLDDLELRVFDKTILHYQPDEREYEFKTNNDELGIFLPIGHKEYLELNPSLKAEHLWKKLITEVCEYLENNDDLKEYLLDYHSDKLIN